MSTIDVFRTRIFLPILDRPAKHPRHTDARAVRSIVQLVEHTAYRAPLAPTERLEQILSPRTLSIWQRGLVRLAGATTMGIAMHRRTPDRRVSRIFFVPVTKTTI